MTAAEEAALELAVAVSGAGEAERPALEQLCLARAAWWRGRLRPGVTEADCGAAFPCAVALSAAADLGRCAAVSQFTVGELSVRCGEGGDALRTAGELMAPYAADGDFAFRRVRG